MLCIFLHCCCRASFIVDSHWILDFNLIERKHLPVLQRTISCWWCITVTVRPKSLRVACHAVYCDWLSTWTHQMSTHNKKIDESTWIIKYGPHQMPKSVILCIQKTCELIDSIYLNSCKWQSKRIKSKLDFHLKEIRKYEKNSIQIIATDGACYGTALQMQISKSVHTFSKLPTNFSAFLFFSTSLKLLNIYSDYLE